MSTLTEIFGEPISIYTRAQAIDDGVLIDLTDWAGTGPDGMIGGFAIPVACTASVWSDLNHFPKDGLQDLRGRAHDLLWMSACAARRASGRDTVRVQLHMTIGRSRLQTYKVAIGPADDGSPCITIMQTTED